MSGGDADSYLGRQARFDRLQGRPGVTIGAVIAVDLAAPALDPQPYRRRRVDRPVVWAARPDALAVAAELPVRVVLLRAVEVQLGPLQAEGRGIFRGAVRGERANAESTHAESDHDGDGRDRRLQLAQEHGSDDSFAQIEHRS